MAIVLAVVRIFIGAFFGIGATFALLPAFAAFTTGKDDSTPIIMISVILVGAILGFFAPTVRRAFGRGFLILGASVFVLPVSAFLLSGRAASDVVGGAEDGSEAFAAVGAGLAGVAITGVATFFGLILGSILLMIGMILTLGGRREVIVVETVMRQEPRLKK